METVKNISKCIKRLRSADKLARIAYKLKQYLRQTKRSADKKKRQYIPALQF
jgi:hypothetical protein